MHKLYGIQWLRGFAAIMVVMFHAASRWGYDLEIGEAGVDIFFVMSGFIMWPVADKQTSPLRFLRDRIVRVVPTYWIATGLMVVGGMAGLFPHVAISAVRIAQSLLFIPAISDHGLVYPMLVQGWTLNYEMMFYALFSLLIVFPGVIRLWLLVGALSLLSLLHGTTLPRGVILTFYTDPIVLEFAMGALLGHYFSRWRLDRRLACAFVALGLGLFVAAGLGEVQAIRFIRLGLPAALVVSGTIGLETSGARFTIRPLIFLGDASYAVYLFHTFAISLAYRFLRSVPGLTGPVLATVCGVAGGALAYVLLEKPLTNALRRRKRVPDAQIITDTVLHRHHFEGELAETAV